MKQLIIFLSLIFVCALSNAQDVIVKDGTSYVKYTGVAADTAKGTTALAKSIFIPRNDAYLYDLFLKLDSLNAGHKPSIVIGGSYDGVNYTTLNTIAWGMTTADTTIRVNNLSKSYVAANDTIASSNYTLANNEIMWRWLKITVTGAGANHKSKINYFLIKVGK
jgi:hypothetical protein